MIEIIVQFQEDHPFNPGWWRWSRPQHRVVDRIPAPNDNRRWGYGDVEQALVKQAEWDAQYPDRATPILKEPGSPTEDSIKESAYATYHKEAVGLLEDLKAVLMAMPAFDYSQAITWGHVDSLGQLNKELRNTLDFIRP